MRDIWRLQPPRRLIRASSRKPVKSDRSAVFLAARPEPLAASSCPVVATSWRRPDLQNGHYVKFEAGGAERTGRALRRLRPGCNLTNVKKRPPRPVAPRVGGRVLP